MTSAHRILSGFNIPVILLLPDVLKRINCITGLLRDFSKCRISVRVGNLLVVVGQGEGGALGVEVVLALDASPALADYVAIQPRFGRVLSGDGAGFVPLLEDIVGEGIPEKMPL